jgi:D-alanyl-D-alanine carboxypeptidase
MENPDKQKRKYWFLEHRKKVLIFLLIVSCYIVSSCVSSVSVYNPAKYLYTQDDLQEIEKILAENVSQYKLPALIVGITSDDRNLFVKAKGVKVLGQSENLLENDLLHIGSNGKAMTATMIAILVERGILSWDSTPADIYPEIADKIYPEFKSITLSQLLCHSAGVPCFTEEEEFANIPALGGSYTQQRLEFTKWILANRPPYKPGTFHYSNAGYVIAASMAETKTQKSWEFLMKELLFEPLGINAKFGWPAKNSNNQPWGHAEVDGKLCAISPDNKEYLIPEWLAPAGDISMSLPDYLSFLRCHLKGLQGHSLLLDKNTFKLLHSIYNDEGPSGVGVAYGWGVKELNGVMCNVHVGSGGTFYICVALVPEMNIGIAVACNAGNGAASEACTKLLKLLLAKHITKVNAS